MTTPIHTALRNLSKALIRNLSYMVLKLTVLSFRLSFPWDNYLKVCLSTRDLRAKISGCIVKVQRPGNKSRGTATSFIISVVFIHLICTTGNFKPAILNRTHAHSHITLPLFNLLCGPCQRNEKWPNSDLKLNEIHEQI